MISVIHQQLMFHRHRPFPSSGTTTDLYGNNKGLFLHLHLFYTSGLKTYFNGDSPHIFFCLTPETDRKRRHMLALEQTHQARSFWMYSGVATRGSPTRTSECISMQSASGAPRKKPRCGFYPSQRATHGAPPRAHPQQCVLWPYGAPKWSGCHSACVPCPFRFQSVSERISSHQNPTPYVNTTYRRLKLYSMQYHLWQLQSWLRQLYSQDWGLITTIKGLCLQDISLYLKCRGVW